MYQKYLLHISPYTLVVNISRFASDTQPAFIQCEKYARFGSIFGLSLPDISFNCKSFPNLIPHYLNTKLTEMGADNIILRVFTSDFISEVSQYDFDMDKLLGTPK